MKKDVIVVIGGLRIKEWQRERTLAKTFVTMVEVNPSIREGLELMNDVGTKGPKRKVMRMSLPDPARVG